MGRRPIGSGPINRNVSTRLHCKPATLPKLSIYGSHTFATPRRRRRPFRPSRSGRALALSNAHSVIVPHRWLQGNGPRLVASWIVVVCLRMLPVPSNSCCHRHRHRAHDLLVVVVVSRRRRHHAGKSCHYLEQQVFGKVLSSAAAVSTCTRRLL